MYMGNRVENIVWKAEIADNHLAYPIFYAIDLKVFFWRVLKILNGMVKCGTISFIHWLATRENGH